MACRGFWECLLKLFNFLMTLIGLAMVGYGIYLLVEFIKASGGGDDDSTPAISPASDDQALIQLGRPMLMAVSLSDSIFDKLPKAWFIYLFIGIGVVIFVISCFGCIGAGMRNGCCLCCYSILVALLILVELGCAAFIFFDKSWKEVVPSDNTGDFDTIYEFLRENWSIVKWVALGIVVFEVLLFLLALNVRASNRPADYDSDDEFIQTLAGLDFDHNPLVVQLSDKDYLSWVDLQAQLRTFENRREQLNSFSSLTLSPSANANVATRSDHKGNRSYSHEGWRGNNQRNLRGGRGRGRTTCDKPPCQICGKIGHIAVHCFNRFDKSYTGQSSDERQEKYNAFIASPNSVRDPDWYFDSGARNQ